MLPLIIGGVVLITLLLVSMIYLFFFSGKGDGLGGNDSSAVRRRSSNDSGGSWNSRSGSGSGRSSAASARNSGSAPSVLDSASDAARTTRRAGAKLTLEKRLRFAQWSIPPIAFRIAQIGISLFAMAMASFKLHFILVIVCATIGPILTNAVLNYAIDRRFKAFDADYPAFLLSVVGLLKTGMNPLEALEASARGLTEGAILRDEVEMMIERLRFGVPEEKSIGTFGEDINHPEIELFVQALLLSRRVGGTLSDTLERLSKQVRKRQFFRSSAVAAVGLQRGSIWFIVAILAGLEAYLYIVYPESVVGAWNNPVGWGVWQGGILVILTGIYWVRQVTKIKV